MHTNELVFCTHTPRSTPPTVPATIESKYQNEFFNFSYRKNTIWPSTNFTVARSSDALLTWIHRMWRHIHHWSIQINLTPKSDNNSIGSFIIVSLKRDLPLSFLVNKKKRIVFSALEWLSNLSEPNTLRNNSIFIIVH